MTAQSGNERFDGLPHDWILTPGFLECPGLALKVLVAIVHYWVAGGFKNNGNLVITYKMLRLSTGIGSKETIALCLAQLEALGILIVNHGKWSTAIGARQPNRYGLPWVPIDNGAGHNGGPPLKTYLEITTREEAKQRLAGLKEKRKPRKIRVTVEFDDL
jgi:hypothetical protein